MGTDDLRYWFALKFVDGVGNLHFRTLVDALGSPRSVFGASLERLEAIQGIKKKTAQSIKGFRDWKRADREAELLKRTGVSVLTYQDRDYPGLLLNIYDFPPLLYVRGEIRESDINVAVVGSRAASTYGKFIAERLARDLAYGGATIVSGLARGIDAAAHRGALSARGRTIAVLGCGIDVTYPAENEELYRKIPQCGAIVTEFPFGTPPKGSNFPARNRIISGLSLGVVIIEASEKSGSLITASMALEQGREVFAVPGVIDAPGSRGTHKLLKQGAKLVESANDVLEEIGPQVRFAAGAEKPAERQESPQQPQKPEMERLTDNEQALVRVLSKDPVDVDTIIARSGFSAGETLGLLTGLELSGRIEQLPGKMFVLKID